MMLDMKRTFDDIVVAHSTPERAEQILANPFYQSLSSSFSGTQEYMAMEKLGQLRASEQWDLIIVDTPPSRSALDFLDAPNRMSRFLDGPMIRLLTAPSRAGLKFVSAGFLVFSRIISKVLGGQLLRDISAFVTALDTMFGGFRERATATYELLRRPGTWFVVVATPEPDALREASYFVDRLSSEGMPLAGLVHQPHPPARDHRPLGDPRRGRRGGGRRGRRRRGRPGRGGAAGARRADGRWPPGSSTWPTGSPARTPRSASGPCRPPPATCTTSTGCASWAPS